MLKAVSLCPPPTDDVSFTCHAPRYTAQWQQPLLSEFYAARDAFAPDHVTWSAAVSVCDRHITATI